MHIQQYFTLQSYKFSEQQVPPLSLAIIRSYFYYAPLSTFSMFKKPSGIASNHYKAFTSLTKDYAGSILAFYTRPGYLDHITVKE